MRFTLVLLVDVPDGTVGPALTDALVEVSRVGSQVLHDTVGGYVVQWSLRGTKP